jgi:hypothetical protein
VDTTQSITIVFVHQPQFLHDVGIEAGEVFLFEQIEPKHEFGGFGGNEFQKVLQEFNGIFLRGCFCCWKQTAVFSGCS